MRSQLAACSPGSAIDTAEAAAQAHRPGIAECVTTPFSARAATAIARSLALGGGCEAHFDKLAEVLTRGPQWAGVAACAGEDEAAFDRCDQGGSESVGVVSCRPAAAKDPQSVDPLTNTAW